MLSGSRGPTYILPRWWNGIHGRLKICCLRRLVGSNPTRGTIIQDKFMIDKNKSAEGLREDWDAAFDTLTSGHVFPNDKLSAREQTVFQFTVGYIKRHMRDRLAALRDTGPRPDSGIDEERLWAAYERARDVRARYGWVTLTRDDIDIIAAEYEEGMSRARLSTPRQETSVQYNHSGGSASCPVCGDD